MYDLNRLTVSGLVAHIDYHESLSSTSDRALELAAAGELPLPLLVLAERQTGGRGRGTNRWWSAEGALTFSVALDAPPDRLPPQRWPLVALVAGLAVAEALEPLCPAGTFQVKWPNDVYLQAGTQCGKVCGILSESVPGTNDRLVVGIGVNVNNRIERPELAGAARALVDLDSRPRDLTEVLLAILDRLDQRWRELADGEFPTMAEQYRQRCLLTGRTLTIQTGSTLVVGRCLGIADDGTLKVQTEAGARQIVSGTIEAWE
jgi:BirA family biotin operon repressor/biotin-[acetyl-CoA-carboxylase] ligase